MSPIPADCDPLAELRARTRPAHRRIEATIPVMRMMASGVRLSDVITFLALSCRYHASLEHRLGEPLCATGLYRPRTPVLVKTLRDHGQLPPTAAEIPVPADDPDSLLGVIYTLEGASVGSMMIDQHLRTRLGDACAARIEFFRTFGRDSRDHWRRVSDTLTSRLGNRPEAIERAVGAALIVFEGFESVFRS